MRRHTLERGRRRREVRVRVNHGYIFEGNS
jgi:hypothetical protein